MAMSFLSTAACSVHPVRFPSFHKPSTVYSLSSTLRRHRSTSFCRLRLPPEPPRLSTFPKTATAHLFSSITSTSRTLLFFLVASLLSLSGVRPLPSLAAPTPPTQQPQEPMGLEEQQEPEEGKKRELEVENKAAWLLHEEEAVEVAPWLQRDKEGDDEDGEIQMYREILSSDPGNVDALKCVLFAMMRRIDWDGALWYARRLREAEPGEVEWRLTEALLHELKGDLADAERLFKEVLTEKPLLVRALHGLALCMHRRIEDPTVFQMLEKALHLAISEERVPEERSIKLLIAQMHVVKGQLDVALEKLQNLITEDPRDFRPHLCQGIVYALLDRKEEADEQFDTYRSLAPDEFPDKSFMNDVILAAKME